MAYKLKKMHLTSVDLVRAGANQEAKICIHKSADHADHRDAPTEEEQSLFQRFMAWLKKGAADEDAQGEDAEGDPDQPVEAEDGDPINGYLDALTTSFRSIRDDETIDDDERGKMLLVSLDQFTVAMDGAIREQYPGAGGQDGQDEDNSEPDQEDEPDEAARYDELDEV